MHLNRQLRGEVYDWLTHQKLTIDIKDPGHVFSPWDELILRQARNIQFNISELPIHFSHPTVNLLCSFWQKECHLNQVSFAALYELREYFPNSSLPGNKGLLCQCLLYPIRLVAELQGRPTPTPVKWKQPYSSKILGVLRPTCNHIECSSTEDIASDLDKSLMLLVSAVEQGHRAIVDVICDSVAVDLQERLTTRGNTLLMEAACYGNVQIMKKLLQDRDPGEIRSLLDLQCRSGETALVKALIRENLEMVSCLLDNADPNIGIGQGRNALDAAISMKGDTLTVTPTIDLLCKNVRIDKTAWHSVLRWGALRRPDLVLLMLHHSGIEANESDADGRSLLFHAAESEKAAAKELVAELLSSHGALSDTRDKRGQTPLWLAVRGNNYEVVDLLLGHGGGDGINDVDAEGRTPLFELARSGRAEDIDKLIKSYGASSDARDKRGRTPLWSAVRGNNYQVVDLLLGHGGGDRINDVDAEGRTPLFELARLERAEDVDKLVKSYGALSDVRDRDGRTPLWYAVQCRSYGTIDVLLEASADSTSRGKVHKSSMSYGVEPRHA